MRLVSRSRVEPPAALQATRRGGLTELERARAHHAAQGSMRDFAFAVYRADQVKERLNALFAGKCAYCETFYGACSPMDVEHYRPKGAVREAPAHPGYWWLASHWENLLPSCPDCNRERSHVQIDSVVDVMQLTADALAATSLSGKKDSFPLRAGTPRAADEHTDVSSEQPLLLNPCEDDPSVHLRFVWQAHPPCSLVAPQRGSLRGGASIAAYGLNRLGLVQARTALLMQLEVLGCTALHLATLADRHADTDAEAAMLATLGEMIALAAPDRPYSAMVQSWLDAFLHTLR